MKTLIVSITALLVVGLGLIALPGCAFKTTTSGSTASTASTASTTTATVEADSLADLFTLVTDAAADYAPLLTGGNTQNGQDVANALFEQAAKGTGATLAGQLITAYGGQQLTPLATAVSGYITTGTLNQVEDNAAILNTVGAAIQAISNSNAPTTSSTTSSSTAVTTGS